MRPWEKPLRQELWAWDGRALAHVGYTVRTFSDRHEPDGRRRRVKSFAAYLNDGSFVASVSKRHEAEEKVATALRLKAWHPPKTPT